MLYNILMGKKLYRDRGRAWAIEFLGGKCVQCGSATELEFDHIDPSSRSFRIGACFDMRRDKLIIELKKCQLLCKICHREKTRLENGWQALEHGTVNMYINGKCHCESCRKAWTTYFVPKRKLYRAMAVE
jgi:hypothetical protein